MLCVKHHPRLISTIADYYTDKKRTITAGLGKLLVSTDKGKVPKGDFNKEPEPSTGSPTKEVAHSRHSLISRCSSWLGRSLR